MRSNKSIGGEVALTAGGNYERGNMDYKLEATFTVGEWTEDSPDVLHDILFTLNRILPYMVDNVNVHIVNVPLVRPQTNERVSTPEEWQD